MNVEFLFLSTLRKGRRRRRIEFLAVSPGLLVAAQAWPPFWRVRGHSVNSAGCHRFKQLWPACYVYAYLVSVRAGLPFLGPSRGKALSVRRHIHLVILRRAKGLPTLQLSALEMSKIRSFFLSCQNIYHTCPVWWENSLWFKTEYNVIYAWWTWQKGRTQPSPGVFF